MSEITLPNMDLVACEGRWYKPMHEDCEWVSIPIDDRDKTVQTLVDTHLEFPVVNEGDPAPELQIEFAFEMAGYPTIYWCFDESASWWTTDTTGTDMNLAEAAEEQCDKLEIQISVDKITGLTIGYLAFAGLHVLRRAYWELNSKQETANKEQSENPKDSDQSKLAEPFTLVDVYNSIVNAHERQVLKESAE